MQPFVVLPILLSFFVPIWGTGGGTALAQTDTATPSGATSGSTSGVFVTVTFHACPDGVDPKVDPAACVEVVPPPVGAVVTAAPDYRAPIRDFPLNEEGGYMLGFDTVPGEGAIGFSGFAPSAFNYFTFSGLDKPARWGGSIDLEAGDQREVDVFYYNGLKGLIEPGENTVSVTVLDCPDGVDPQKDASTCTDPVPAAELTGLTGLTYTSQNAGRYDAGTFADLSPVADGTYSFPNINPYTVFGVYDDGSDDASTYVVNGDVEEVRSDNGGGTSYLVRGESREITVYRTTATDTGTPGSPAQGETGTIRVSLRSCPSEVTTREQVSAETCTIPLKDDGTARVFNSAIGVDTSLTNYPYENGSYVLANVPIGTWYFSGLESGTRDAVHTIGQDEIHGANYGVHLEAGETSELIFAYYDEGN
jgi:hypothetical protein